MRLTTVFLADMTPKNPRKGWWVPPLARLVERHHHRAWRGPDHEADGEDEQHGRHELPIALRAGDGLHAEPQVVVGAEEEDADEDGLDDPEPRHEAAHHRDAHGLVERVDLTTEPVPREGQD